MSRHDEAVACEHRPDKPYDERDPGSVVCPNGTIAASGSRWFQGASARAALDLYDLERLRTLATRAVETFMCPDNDEHDCHDVAMTALGAALGFDLEVRRP